jgi:hypothetical protein
VHSASHRCADFEEVIDNGSSAERSTEPQVELVLPGGQPLRSGRFQRGHPGVVMGSRRARNFFVLVLAPGEQISTDAVAALQEACREGPRVAYATDPALATLRVLAE